MFSKIQGDSGGPVVRRIQGGNEWEIVGLTR